MRDILLLYPLSFNMEANDRTNSSAASNFPNLLKLETGSFEVHPDDKLSRNQ
jgi:hypothetical protein